MSFTRQFEPPRPEYPECSGSFPTNKISPQAGAAALLGINSLGMVETIIADISELLSRNEWKSLNGYVLALSRIISHEVAWKCITESFRQSKESVPKKFYEVFSRDYNEGMSNSGMAVS